MMNREIINEFSDHISKPVPLKGGQNTSFRIGNVVVKPISEPEKYIWLANELKNIKSNTLNIARPVLSKSGQYIIQGYGATRFMRCKFYSNRLNEKLEASNAFHELVGKIVKPSSFMEWTSPWSLATQVAWEELSIPHTKHLLIDALLLRLKSLYKPVKLKNQFRAPLKIVFKRRNLPSSVSLQ